MIIKNIKSIITLFDLKQQNQLQKIGFFLAVLILLLLLALHNPIHGYQTETSISDMSGMPSFLLKSWSATELDFLEWRSIGASVDALKSIGTVITWLIVNLLALIVWLIIFSSKTNESEK